MKKIIKAIGLLLGITAVLLGAVYWIAWKSPKYFTVRAVLPKLDSITPFAHYPIIANHPRPYVIEGKNFVIIGASHTRDPQDPQIKLIEEKWHALRPTIALVEGRLGFLLPGMMDPVKNLGEGGKVNELAKDAGVPVYNWDLSKEVLALQLQQVFPAEQVALAQVLNPYFGQLRFGKPASPESYIQGYLSRAAFVKQEHNFKTTTDVDRVWKKYFPAGKDWRETSDETALPGFLAEIMTYSNDLRNRQLVSAVRELTTRNEKVFLVCGSSHAACVAPAFR